MTTQQRHESIQLHVAHLISNEILAGRLAESQRKRAHAHVSKYLEDSAYQVLPKSTLYIQMNQTIEKHALRGVPS